jgi:hypothetical protein
MNANTINNDKTAWRYLTINAAEYRAERPYWRGRITYAVLGHFGPVCVLNDFGWWDTVETHNLPRGLAERIYKRARR